MLSSRPADIQLHPSKTPGRMKGRGENAIRGPMTVQGKGKEAVGRTPYHPTTLHPQKLFKDGSTTQPQLKPTVLNTRPATRPLVDKTPFPNRIGGQQFRTPLPQGSKLAGLSFLEPGTLSQLDKTPDALLRPSSTRKRVRTPRSGNKNFETPANNGNHWDVSDLSIAMPEAQVQAQEPAIEHDYDEIEYMAPNTLDLPYEPPFDFELPDYKEVGKKLFELSHSYRDEEVPMPEWDFPVDQIKFLPWDMLDVPELGPDEDDPFYRPEVEVKAAPKVPAQLGSLANKVRAVTSRPVPPSKPKAITRVPSVSSTTTISRATASRISRPGTGTSSTTGTIRPALKRANATASTTTAATSTLRTAAASRTIASRPGISTTKQTTSTTTLRNKLPTSGIPPRPATSTATRVRTAANINSTMPIRRPTTSAAMYRPGMKKPVAVQDVIAIRGDLDLDDDFRFDV